MSSDDMADIADKQSQVLTSTVPPTSSITRTKNCPTSFSGLPAEVQQIIFTYIAHNDDIPGTWSEREGAIKSLSDASCPAFIQTLPRQQEDAFAYQYFNQKVFSIDIDMNTAAAGIRHTNRQLETNGYISAYLATRTDPAIRVKHLMLAVTPELSSVPGCEGESGVHYRIDINPATSTVKVGMCHEWRAQFMLAWTPRRRVLTAIKHFCRTHVCTDGESIKRGFKAGDIEKLLQLIYTTATQSPVTYDLQMWRVMLVVQESWRRMRRRQTKAQLPYGDDITDDEEYAEEQ